MIDYSQCEVCGEFYEVDTNDLTESDEFGLCQKCFEKDVYGLKKICLELTNDELILFEEMLSIFKKKLENHIELESGVNAIELRKRKVLLDKVIHELSI